MMKFWNFTLMWPCILTNFFIIKPTDALISQIYFFKKLYMFRVFPLSIIRSFPLYIRPWYMSSNLHDICQCQVYSGNSRWWAEELLETCRVSWQNNFGKLVRLLFLLNRNFESYGRLGRFCLLFAALWLKEEDISSTNFSAQFSLFINNMFVTLLSSTCFEH